MQADQPRVLVLSQRDLRPRVSRCVGYEFEGLVAKLSDTEWAVPHQSPAGFLPEVAVNRMNKRFRSAAVLKAPFPRLEPGDGFDVMLATMQLPSDLTTLAAVPNWRKRTQKAVCYIEEMWAVELDRWQGHIKLLDQFDHVFLGSLGTVDALQARLKTKVSYLPFGVDALRFMAPPGAPRWIDVMNIGRRSPITHRALLDWADTSERLYYYDSFTPGDFYDVAQHRRLLAGLMKRTKIAITNRGIGARPFETGGQEELAFRYFEAAAAGAVLLGSPPNTGVTSTIFGWEDALIEAPFDAPMMGEFVGDLLSQSDRVAAISARNTRESLLRHDHVYRWETMLKAVEVKPGDLVEQRKATLLALSEDY